MAEGKFLKDTGIITTEADVANTNFAGYVNSEDDTKTVSYGLLSDKIFKDILLDKIASSKDIVRKNTTGDDVEGVALLDLLGELMNANDKSIIVSEGGTVSSARLDSTIKAWFMTENNSLLFRNGTGDITYKLLDTLLDAGLLTVNNQVIIRESGSNIGKDLGKAIAENVLNGLPDANKVLVTNGAGADVSGIEIEKFRTLAPITIHTPLKGVLDDQVYLVGSRSTVTSGQTGDYTTDFDAGEQKLAFSMNDVTGSGNINILGTRLVTGTNVPETSFSEDIAFTNTVGSQYQSVNSYLDVQSIKISYDTTGTINYNISKLDYDNINGKKFKITGYTARFFSGGGNPDVKLVIQKVKKSNAIDQKFEIVNIEVLGIDANGQPIEKVDSIRSGGDSRSYTSAEDWDNNQTQKLEMSDFDTYFTTENIIDGTNQEGIIISVSGQGTPNLKDIDFVNLRVDLVFDNFG